MYQSLTIVGNVGKDPEMRYTPTGQAVTSFSVATNRQYTGSNGEQVKETIWFVSTWGKLAETATIRQEGLKVLVEGRLTPIKRMGPRIWQKSDGSRRPSVTAGTVRFLSNRGEGGGEAPMAGGMEHAEMPAEDDIPF
jgi:single-strand DNA-binding protein